MNKNILFVNFSKDWGGGEKWHLISAKELLKRNYHVQILANKNSALYYKAIQEEIVCKVLKISNLSFFNPINLLQIFIYLKKTRPSTIILNGSKELKAIGIIAKLLKVKKIIYRRGIPRRIKLNLFNLFLFKRVVSHIIVNSQNTLNAIQNIFDKIDNHSPVIIYNGIETKADKKSNNKSKKIGVVGRLSYEKGIDMAIKALPKIRKGIPDVSLRIVGDGHERNELEKLVTELGLNKVVEFTGFKDNVLDYLKECSILVMPSRWEGFGFTLLEAMKLKMPCVAFDNNSLAEIIEHGVTGYLVESYDIEQLAETVIKLLKSPKGIKKMGNAGYKCLINKFSIDKSIDKLEEIINN